MGILSWFRRTVPTPVTTEFGVLEFRNGSWTTEITLGSETPAIYLGGDSDGPLPQDQTTLRSFVDSYEELRPALGARLIRMSDEHVANLGEFAAPDFPRPRSAEEVLQVFSLASIRLNEAGRPVLLYTYRDLDDDAMIELTVDEKGISGEHVGD